MSWQQRITEAMSHWATLGDSLPCVADELERSAIYLGHGTDNAWDEAVHLIFAALKLPLQSDESVMSVPLSQKDRLRVLAYLKQRIDERRPLPYITHQAWFMGLPFFVDERVLIPRSPIGGLMGQGFSPWVNPQAVQRICEVGTGSGCIAIGLALVFASAKVDAIDICPDALAVAERNVTQYELSSRIQLLLGDGLSGVRDQQYDLIVANPPYVPSAEKDLLPTEYKHEPELALYSGDSGLDIVDQLLVDAKTCLSDKGVLLIEVGQTAVTVEERYPSIPFVWLDCEHGGEGVLLLTKQDLLDHSGSLCKARAIDGR